MGVIDYWKREWNNVATTNAVTDDSCVLGQEKTTTPQTGIFYFNAKGELIKQEKSDERKNYLCLPVEGDLNNTYYVTLPNRDAMRKMRQIGREMSEYEKGIIIATDGSCSPKIVIGSRTGIAKNQWDEQLDCLLKEGKRIAYFIHSHPVCNLGNNPNPVTVGSKEPSDIDVNTQFYEDKVGAIIYWTNEFNKPLGGFSRNKEDYRAHVSFYAEKTGLLLSDFFLGDFEKLFGRL